MLFFVNDYAEGAHEKILKKMLETNLEKTPGYGVDHYCQSATEKIRTACKCPEADVYYLVGGTQTNQVVIDTVLAPYEGVIAAQTGHINCHEAGAIEYSGHKVLPLPHKEGKINADDLKKLLVTFYGDESHEHMTFPGMVYVSYPTEYGTLYSKKELEDIHEVCEEYSIPLFLDGARLGYGLTCKGCDMTMADIAQLTDVFYIGGTKVGALFGEAVVFTKKNMPKHFATRVKQHGAMLAKGRLLGLQFDTLFTDGLYEECGRHANEMAQLIREALIQKGYTFYVNSPTNQIFVVLEDTRKQELDAQVNLCFWEKPDENHTVVRIATSWATLREDVDALIALL